MPGRHEDADGNGIADFAEAHPYGAVAETARALTATSSDTLWADVSSYQPVVTDAYPYRVLAIRSNDGTYRDPHFAANYAWALGAIARGRLDVLIVYFVYRQNWQQTVATHTAMLGATHPGVVSMIDVESWGGQIAGDQSAGINGCAAACAAFHDGNRLRVVGYGNRSDLNALWPNKAAGMRLVVAAYGSNPAYPGKLAHQFSDSFTTPPFGACDINSADGMSVADVKAALGLAASPPAPTPAVYGALMQDKYPLLGSDYDIWDVACGTAAADGRWIVLTFTLFSGALTGWIDFQTDKVGVGSRIPISLTVGSDNLSPRAVIGVPSGVTKARVGWDATKAVKASMTVTGGK